MSRLLITRQNGGRIEYRTKINTAWTGFDSNHQSVMSDQLKFDAENHPCIDCELSGRKADLVCRDGTLKEATRYVPVFGEWKSGHDLPRQEFEAKALAQDSGFRSTRLYGIAQSCLQDKIYLWREMRSVKEEVMIRGSKTETDFLNDSRLFASSSERITVQMALYSSPGVFGYGADMQPLDIQRDFNWSFKPPRD